MPTIHMSEAEAEELARKSPAFRHASDEAKRKREGSQAKPPPRSGAKPKQEGSQAKPKQDTDAYQPTAYDKQRTAQQPPSITLTPPKQSSGVLGEAESGFAILTLVAVTGLALFNVKPFSSLLDWAGGVVKDFGALAAKKG